MVADGVIYQVYPRSYQDSNVVVLNFGSGQHAIDLSRFDISAERVLSTRRSGLGDVDLADFELRADEGVLLRLP